MLNTPKKTILIVEDEAPIREMVRFALELEGFILLEAEDWRQTQQICAKQLPQLILLDWMLPDTSGIEIARLLKRDEHTRNIAIIMLTAKAEEENKIKGLEAGADDYIVKPFSPRELIARIKTVLRRGPLESPEAKIHFADMQIDTANQCVTIANQEVKLGTLEYRLLHFLLSHANRIYSREQLLNQVWGMHTDIDDRTVDVSIRRLRLALEPYQYNHHIQTVRGSGYRFGK
ncbi:phosphate regulon transcriptional regulator PhoB [soil metagenome]